jgi:hypothetical protein
MDVEVLKRGAISGAVGATVLALWFLAVDFAVGDPLRTVAFVSDALLGGGAATIPAYTVLHYISFTVIGLTAAWALHRVPVKAPYLVGTALGFFLFDMIFYWSVAVTGADVVAEVGWGEVLVGNIVAGITVVGIILRMQAPEEEAWLKTVLSGDGVVRDGIVIGLGGASAVAIWFLVLDTLRGQPLFTPSALGAALLTGQVTTVADPISVPLVLGYTGVHGAVFIAAGLFVAGIARAAVESPPLLMLFFLLTVAFHAFFMGLVAILAEYIPTAWWAAGVGNLLAGGVMVLLAWRANPELGRRVSEPGVVERPDVEGPAAA